MIFIVRGTTCSGKDTLVKRYFNEHCVLSSDKIRLTLLDNISEQSGSEEVFKYLRHTLEQRLRFGTNHTVINATNLRFSDCVEYIDIAKKFGRKVNVISIDPPPLEVLLQRSNDRVGDSEVSQETIERHIARYNSCMPRFIEYAKEDPAFTFTRVNQNYEVVTQ